MRKLILLVLFLAPGVGSAELAKESAQIAWVWDPTSTNYTYCRYIGQGGDPMGGSIPGPGLIETDGSNTHFVESVTDSLPFTDLAVGDLIEVKLPNENTWLKRVITVKTSGADVTVDTATDLGASGVVWRYLERECGETSSDGWVSVGNFYNVTFSRTITTINATSIQTQAECRLNANPTVATALATDSSTGTGAWGWTMTAGVWDACRLGVKITGDAGAQSVTAAMAVSRLTGPTTPPDTSSVEATKDLTEGVATAVVQIDVPQTTGANFADALIVWKVEAADATNVQVRKGASYLAAVNAAGTEACSVGDVGTTVAGVNSGTLTCTNSCIVGLTDAVQFAMSCTSSLTQTSLRAVVVVEQQRVNVATGQ